MLSKFGSHFMIDRDLWELWLSVTLEITVDCRRIVVFDPLINKADNTALFDALGWASDIGSGSLYILTAWNPGGVKLPMHLNRRAQAELLSQLGSLGCNFWPSVGSSGSWIESGTAFLSGDDALAQALGHRYKQLAYYRVEMSQIWCVEVGNTHNESPLIRVV